jgi:hypothetical protein
MMFEYQHLVPLLEADNPSLYGGKASQLCSAVRNNLPVPKGIAIAFNIVHDLILGRLSLKGFGSNSARTRASSC